jgi:type IV secretory pathway TrbD component
MNIRDDLRKMPIRRSLTRTQMLVGGERNLVLIAALTSVIIGLTISLGTSFLLGVLIAGILWSIECYLLKTMAKADQIMSKIYIRSSKYKAFYPAKGRYDSIINPRFN